MTKCNNPLGDALPAVSSLGHARRGTAHQIMTAAATVQTQLLAQGIFMVDAGTIANKVGGYRFTLTYAGEIERFYTLQQVKTWIKYNLA